MDLIPRLVRHIEYLIRARKRVAYILTHYAFRRLMLGSTKFYQITHPKKYQLQDLSTTRQTSITTTVPAEGAYHLHWHEETMCAVWNIPFSTEKQLIDHLFYQHTNPTSKTCNIWGKEFTRLGFLKNHIKLAHISEAIEWKLCGAKISNRHYLYIHMIRQHDYDERSLRRKMKNEATPMKPKREA
jgi:uncharacterized Zn-finger protein